jgi:replicative DNA helicase
VSFALNSSEPVGFISSEMSVDQITLRILSGMSEVSLNDATRHMTQEQWDKWNAASANFRESPIYINDRPSITPDEIARQTRKWVYNNGIKILIVDYLQRLGGDPRADRVQRIRDAVSICKEISRTLNIHVIALSQVKREVEYRQDKRPCMADFDGASTIESEADAAIALFRPWKYDRTQPPQAAEFIVVKNRHGMEGTVHVKFQTETVRFLPDHKSNNLPF